VSNLRTGVVSSIVEHPIREFYDRGLIVTVNSDDPSLFNTTINNEYLQLHEHLNFTLEELFDLSLNAINTAFIDDSMKTKLLESFRSEYQSIREAVVRL
jgi:adenosine deaminase